MRVSLRFRKGLKKLFLNLIEGGINALPKWVDSKAPALRKHETYARYLVESMRPDDEFVKLLAKRFEEDARVGGISVICGVGNLVGIDYDPLKVMSASEAMKTIERFAKGFGHMIYGEVRVGKSKSRGTFLGGLHAFLFLPTEIIQQYEITINHTFPAEFKVRTTGLITISPSIYLDRKEKSVSAYVPISEPDVTILVTLYDDTLNDLRKLIEVLGGELVVTKIGKKGRKRGGGGSKGEPYHGMLDGKLVPPEKVFELYKLVAEYVGCEGLKRLVEALEADEPYWPVPYFIYSQYVKDCNHPRSSWTIVENALFRMGAEMGLSDEAMKLLYERVAEAEQWYEKVRGPVDHDTLEDNFEMALNFKEHGHDMAGACVLKLCGLCTKDCMGCLSGLVASKAFREAAVKAIRKILSG